MTSYTRKRIPGDVEGQRAGDLDFSDIDLSTRYGKYPADAVFEVTLEQFAEWPVLHSPVHYLC